MRGLSQSAASLRARSGGRRGPGGGCDRAGSASECVLGLGDEPTHQFGDAWAVDNAAGGLSSGEQRRVGPAGLRGRDDLGLEALVVAPRLLAMGAPAVEEFGVGRAR